ncbi:hypothetical protein B0H10DRAFT_2226157 [Mycena sp. CBHHK59/15]|nr:hypothetical protein B0H10DRAFT_2226157 [Mycena sp. CBHHK59/15]
MGLDAGVNVFVIRDGGDGDAVRSDGMAVVVSPDPFANGACGDVREVERDSEDEGGSVVPRNVFMFHLYYIDVTRRFALPLVPSLMDQFPYHYQPTYQDAYGFNWPIPATPVTPATQHQQLSIICDGASRATPIFNSAEDETDTKERPLRSDDSSVYVPDLSGLLLMTSESSVANAAPLEKPAKAKKPRRMKKPKKDGQIHCCNHICNFHACGFHVHDFHTCDVHSQGHDVFWVDSAAERTLSLFGGGNTLGDEPDIDAPQPIVSPSSMGTRWPDGMVPPSSPATTTAAAMAERGGMPSGATYAIDPRLLKDPATPARPLPQPYFNGAKLPNNHGPRGTIYCLSPLFDVFKGNPTPAVSTTSLSSSVAAHSIPTTGRPFGSGSHAAQALSALLAPAATGAGAVPPVAPLVAHPVVLPITPLIALPVTPPIAPPVAPPITPLVVLPIALPDAPPAEPPAAPPTAPLIYPRSHPMAKQPTQVDADEGLAPKPRGRPPKKAAKLATGRARGLPPKSKAAARVTMGDGDPDCQQVNGQQASGAALVDVGMRTASRVETVQQG